MRSYLQMDASKYQTCDKLRWYQPKTKEGMNKRAIGDEEKEKTLPDVSLISDVHSSVSEIRQGSVLWKCQKPSQKNFVRFTVLLSCNNLPCK